MSKFVWSGFEWNRSVPGTGLHQDKRKFWYDPDCVSVSPADGSLRLFTRHNPRTFPSGAPVMGAGCVASAKTFGYGTFEIYCRLPKGRWLWPAFWGMNGEEWPPEVDIFEGYSDGRGSYRDFQWLNPFAPWAVRTNAWYKSFKHRESCGQKQHSAMDRDPSGRFEYYRLEWHKDCMKIFFGTKQVRKFTCKDLLARFARLGMTIVINNAVRTDAKELGPGDSSEMQVRYFSYKPL